MTTGPIYITTATDDRVLKTWNDIDNGQVAVRVEIERSYLIGYMDPWTAVEFARNILVNANALLGGNAQKWQTTSIDYVAIGLNDLGDALRLKAEEEESPREELAQKIADKHGIIWDSITEGMRDHYRLLADIFEELNNEEV